MSPERWRRLEALFDQAMELPEAERGGFLDESCVNDPALRRELDGLLMRPETGRASLREVVAAEARVLAGDTIAGQIGRRVGPFRLVKLLGEGGMGAVYLAERDDAQFAQCVAIKMLPHAVGSSHAVARFRDERQILAALEHPNIVRLLDGGSTEDQLPYLVMEYIEGTTIIRYANERRLSIRARIALIRQVCTALQYAHQNLVIHRDIKPSNIFVDAEGTPKILDFGIAKLLAPVGHFEREARTRTGFAMFTPEYASPEQARGDAVSTATDVYSLGAVLYEIVADQPVHRINGSAIDILRVICEVDPPRPSAVGRSTWRRDLAGDLDNIILKALHKEPARRYASMEQLSDDLGRWLDGLPVTARTATFGYRALKFARRNKGLVVVATLLVATLLGATLVSLRQARRADEQAVRAELERANAVEAAGRAEAEAARARRAEVRVQEQLDRLTAEQHARVAAEAQVRVKSDEVEMSREQLQVALTRAREGKYLAEQESAKARAAEARAQQAAEAEAKARKEAEALYQKERERARRLEEASQTITKELP
jgi:hypothetical protein